MMALSRGKEIVMIGLAIEGQSASVMDRQKCHGYTALCIALHGKNRMYNDTNKLTQGQRQHCYSIPTNKFPLVVHVKNPVLYPASYKFLYCSTDTFSALTLLVERQEGHPACKKTEWWGAGIVICLDRGADLHMAQLMPLPLTVSCFSKVQIGFTFLVPAHLGSPGKGPLNGCVCIREI